MAVSHSFDHGSDEAAKKASASFPKILSPIGLSRRLPVGRHAARPARWYKMRLALRRSVLPKPLVPMTMNLSSRSRLRKLLISGVSCRRRRRIFGDADVVGVHGPCAHMHSEGWGIVRPSDHEDGLLLIPTSAAIGYPAAAVAAWNGYRLTVARLCGVMLDGG
jgi:hypothetical protein